MHLNINNKHFIPGLNILSLVWLLLTLTSISLKAQTNAFWTPNTGEFDNYMTITSYFLLNEEELNSDQFEIACFVEGECRGSYKLQEMPYLGHPYPGFLSIWGSSADNGKAISVKIYDHQNGRLYQANETPQFLYNESIGINAPYKFTITGVAEYSIQIASSEGGTVSAGSSSSLSGETITLTLTPNDGYQPDTIVVYKTGDESTTVTTEGTGNTRTFTMPGFGVTVSATFREIDDSLDLEKAETLLENATIVVLQNSANTQNELVDWLVRQINASIQSTGISVSASDITIGSFAAATKGSADNLAGTDGSFNYTVTLQKGSNSVSTEPKTGAITATQIYTLTLAAAENGSLISNKQLVEKGETVTLTITPASNYQPNTIIVYKTGDESTTVTTEGTGNTRTFTMPGFGVTVSATFREIDDSLDLEKAETLLENATFVVPQNSTNTQNELVDWLVRQINASIQSTGISVSASDITIGSFAAATKGSADNLAGTDGSFNYAVTLQKGSNSVSTKLKTGTITATPYIFKAVNIVSFENEFLRISNTGNIETGALYLALSGDFAEEFSLSPVSLGNLSVGSDTSILVIPNEGLASGNYTLTLTIEADNMAPASLIFTYQIIRTSASVWDYRRNKVWASNGRLNILASTEEKAYVYTILGTLVEVVYCNPNEQKKVSLKSGVYIVALGRRSYKILVN